jgi:hypothetical protein
MLTTDEEFDLMWRIAHGNNIVPYGDIGKFKEGINMPVDDFYLTNREEAGDTMYERCNELGWRQVGSLTLIKERDDG